MANGALANIVLDSSVVIKWFSEEEDTDKALAIRDEYSQKNIEIAVPDLLLYEIANALRYNKSLTEEDIKKAVDSLLTLGIDIIVPTGAILHAAIFFALKYNLTIYDSYFLALAYTLDFTYLTADEKLYHKTKSLSFVQLLRDFHHNI